MGAPAIGIGATEVHVGGGGGIAITTGVTTGEGATTMMIVGEATTAGATIGTIAANIVDGGADRQLSRQTGETQSCPYCCPPTVFRWKSSSS